MLPQSSPCVPVMLAEMTCAHFVLGGLGRAADVTGRILLAELHDVQKDLSMYGIRLIASYNIDQARTHQRRQSWGSEVYIRQMQDFRGWMDNYLSFKFCEYGLSFA